MAVYSMAADIVLLKLPYNFKTLLVLLSPLLFKFACLFVLCLPVGKYITVSNVIQSSKLHAYVHTSVLRR